MDDGMEGPDHRSPEDETDSLSLFGAVSLGTGVMIGAGIFVLTGQIAALAGDLFPLAFLSAAVVMAFSANSYVKLADAFPSSGGVAMFLREAYGLGTATGVFALLMYVSMVVSESLVARTFGAYILQIVDLKPSSFWVLTLGVVLLSVAFAVNVAGNRAVQASQSVMAILKVGGLAVFAVVGLWSVNFTNLTSGSAQTKPIVSGDSWPVWPWPYSPTRDSPPSPTVEVRSSTPIATPGGQSSSRSRSRQSSTLPLRWRSPAT